MYDEIRNYILLCERYARCTLESASEDITAYSPTRQQSHLALVLQGPVREVSDVPPKVGIDPYRKTSGKRLNALIPAGGHKRGVTSSIYEVPNWRHRYTKGTINLQQKQATTGSKSA